MRQAQLRWEQIDPRIARQVGECLQQSEQAGALTRPVQSATSAAELGGWALAAFIASLFVGLYLTVFFNIGGPATMTTLFVLPVGLLITTTAPTPQRRARAREAFRRLRGPITPDGDLQGAFQRAAVSRAEGLYAEVILLLAAEPRTGDRHLRREILRECNALLRDYFHIRGKRERAARLMPPPPEAAVVTAETEAERRALTARRDAATDAIARESWQESLSLLEERTDSLRSLHSSLMRLEAHEEVICQALALARAAVTRAAVSPESLRSPEIARLRRAVRRLTARTEATEEVNRWL